MLGLPWYIIAEFVGDCIEREAIEMVVVWYHP